jgi:hypothetical protein
MRPLTSLAGVLTATIVLGACNITPPPPAAPTTTAPPTTAAPTAPAPPTTAPTAPSLTAPAPLAGAEHVFTGAGSPTSGDWHAFPFTVAAGSTVRATLDWNGSADLNLFLLSGGATSQYANTTTARPEALTSTLTAGTYEVAVKVKSGEQAAFTVSLDVTGSTPTTTAPPTTTTPPPPATGWRAQYPGDVAPGKVRWGAAIAGNADPARHESVAGRALGVRRTFFQWTQRTGSMVDTARGDLAAGRLPWVSVKPPSWAAMAAGTHDAEIDQMLRALDGLNGPVWLTVHHEPEGGAGVNSPDDPAGAAGWRAMQIRVRQRLDALGVDNVAFAPILMSWTFDSRSGRNPADWWVDGIWDFAGNDHYWDKESGAIGVNDTAWTNTVNFYSAKGLDLALGEWGNRGTDTTAANEMQAFYNAALASGTSGRSQIVALSYFDSDLNSPTGGWSLYGEPLTKFRQLMTASTSLLVNQSS